MVKAKETTTRTFRAAPETLDKIRDLTKSLGLKSQGELLEQMLDAWEFRRRQDMLPETESPMERLRIHQEAIEHILKDALKKQEKCLAAQYLSKIEILENELKNLRKEKVE